MAGLSVPGNSCFSCGPLPNAGCVVRVPDTCVYHSGSVIVGPPINTGDTLATTLTRLVSYINTSVPTANEGVTITSNVIQLGQLVGASGNPALLTENREIPMGNFSLSFSVTQGQFGWIKAGGLQLTNQFQGADGLLCSLSNYSSPIVVYASVYGVGFEEFAFVSTQTGFFGYDGVTSAAYITGANGATNNKFTNGHVAAFNAEQVWDGSGGVGGNQLVGSMISYFSCLNNQSGRVTNAYDLYASELNSVGSTTNPPNVTNHYALYAEAFTEATNNYGVYINGAQTNYLGGKLGIGETAPTALLHLKAGTATAGTSPIKLTPGTLLGTPEDGTLEYDGTHLYFTIGSSRHTLV